ncbi:MAG: hypothetical protein K6G83_09595 [Lachnospiraceae bacterium]|nr:hypothetical protein [Lachnospiraceae bacterium]
MMTKNRLQEEELLAISGGSEQYDMENDPLFAKFCALWKHEKESGNPAMQSRTEFLENFKNWLASGMPDSLADFLG